LSQGEMVVDGRKFGDRGTHSAFNFFAGPVWPPPPLTLDAPDRRTGFYSPRSNQQECRCRFRCPGPSPRSCALRPGAFWVSDSSGILILEKLILNPRARHWEKRGQGCQKLYIICYEL